MTKELLSVVDELVALLPADLPGIVERAGAGHVAIPMRVLARLQTARKEIR